MNEIEMFNEINTYMQHINFAHNCLEAYIGLLNASDKYEEIINEAPGFFTITRYALSKCTMLQFAKLYCDHKDERNMRKLINVAQVNAKVFTDESIKKLCNNAIRCLDKELICIVKKLKTRRDKDLAHNDPEYFDGTNNPAKENYISVEEFEILYSFAFGVCSSLIEALPGEYKIELQRGADDLENLFKKCQKGIETI